MQRDSELTLREIHGCVENLVCSIADIQKQALVKVIEDDTPLNLRFITPCQHSEDWTTDKNCSEYALTLPGHLGPDQEYISVSYTWAHSQKIDESSPLPNYRIRDRATPDAPSRPIKCPPLVFHRAIGFARARNCPYVWIDQECIYQDDAEDKERHLQVMHKIYKESRWTVAILSNEMPDTMLSALSLVTHKVHQKWNGMPQLQNWPADVDISPLFRDFVKDSAKALASILSDRWFRRAWTFHEKHCASACVLLAPVNHRGDAAAQLPLDWIGNDVCFSFRSVRDMANLRTVLQPLDHEPWPLQYRFGLAPFLYEIDPSKPTAYGLLFEVMERCDNLVCSDRLTILANVCSYRYKLNSTILNDAKYSYSTCILALIMANEVDHETGVQGINILELDLDKPIEEALRTMGVIKNDWNHLA
jgi:hypothetical protein